MFDSDVDNWTQETSTFDNVTISFTTSPLSEYVGSHIYQLLGYTAHNTMLGYYFNKELSKKQIVVACEDFTDEFDPYKREVFVTWLRWLDLSGDCITSLQSMLFDLILRNVDVVRRIEIIVIR